MGRRGGQFGRLSKLGLGESVIPTADTCNVIAHLAGPGRLSAWKMKVAVRRTDHTILNWISSSLYVLGSALYALRNVSIKEHRDSHREALGYTKFTPSIPNQSLDSQFHIFDHRLPHR